MDNINKNNTSQNTKINDIIQRLGNTSDIARFVQYPSDWLGSYNNITCKRVSIIGTNNLDDYNEYTPDLRKEGNNCAYWNVLTFGTGSRCTQLAFYGFDINRNSNSIYIRRQHDTTVSKWYRLISSADFEYKYLGEFDFKSTATLPSEYTELNIITKVNGYNFCFYINKKELSSATKPYLHGSYWNTNNNYGIHLNVSQSSIYFANCTYNTVQDTSAKMRIYYR